MLSWYDWEKHGEKESGILNCERAEEHKKHHFAWHVWQAHTGPYHRAGPTIQGPTIALGSHCQCAAR